MQRVRIGLTGLSIVFLLVLLAAAVFGLVRDEDAARTRGNEASAVAARSGNAGDAEKEPPREPLAELGVTPGGTPEAETAPENAAGAAPPLLTPPAP